ncbi:MAG: hypothetical protein M1829_006504 [Trizodia sp. TS-e1964]|nr:MAG: hypothetical protein M1829_006504 [Trizodia sp. TS-e1964]
MAESDSEYDSDLQKAIDMSLEEPARSTCPLEIIDLEASPNVDQHVDRLAPSHHSKISDIQLPVRESFTKPAARTLVSSQGDSFSLNDLNRAEMERDRQARLKRQRTISPPPLKRGEQRSAKILKTTRPGLKADDSDDEDVQVISSNKVSPRFRVHPVVGQVKEQSYISSGTGKPEAIPQIISNGLSSIPSTLGKSSQEFPDGVVKKTWAFGHKRKDDIKIEEVLQKDDLTLAILSAFQWDTEWVFSKIDLTKTKVICVMQADNEKFKEHCKSQCSDVPNIRFCFPSMAGNINCMHSKLQLLFHPSYLRIAVPTANLISQDWGEQGMMENSVFIIDLPRLPHNPQASGDLTFFGKELVYFLEAQGLIPDAIHSLQKFDFSKTSKYAFIHTIALSGGSHGGEDWRRTGYCGLGRAIRKLGLQTQHDLDIDYVTSSMGALNDQLLSTLYLAAQGNDGLIEYGWRTDNPKTSRKGASSAATSSAMEQQGATIRAIHAGFRVYFPTRETVLSSKGPEHVGGSICSQSRWYNAPTFPRDILRDCESRRSGLLMHNKVQYTAPPPPIINDATLSSFDLVQAGVVAGDGRMSAAPIYPKVHG